MDIWIVGLTFFLFLKFLSPALAAADLVHCPAAALMESEVE